MKEVLKFNYSETWGKRCKCGGDLIETYQPTVNNGKINMNFDKSFLSCIKCKKVYKS